MFEEEFETIGGRWQPEWGSMPDGVAERVRSKPGVLDRLRRGAHAEVLGRPEWWRPSWSESRSGVQDFYRTREMLNFALADVILGMNTGDRTEALERIRQMV